MKKLRPGQPISKLPGGTWNQLVDAAQTVQQWAASGSALPGITRPGIVRVQNNVYPYTRVDRWAILGIDGVTVSSSDNAAEFAGHPTLSGITPVPGTHDDAFVVTLDGIASGGVGPAIISGLTAVQITVSQSWHKYAIINTGSASLTSAAVGPARILWKSGTSGVVSALVMLGVGTDPRLAMVPVQCWVDGGTSTGDATHLIDQTYTCKMMGYSYSGTDGLLGTGLTPKIRNQSGGTSSDYLAYHVQPGTASDAWIGYGYFDETGAFTLYSVTEAIDTAGVS